LGVPKQTPHALGAHFAKQETASSVMLSGPIARHTRRQVKAKHLVLTVS
jgi:hypothetical protein